MNLLQKLRGLVGNSLPASIGIGVFILLFVFFGARCAKADELDIRPGYSFGHSTGFVLGLQYLHPLPLQQVSFYAGTDLWGMDSIHDANNWDWHAGLQVCRGAFCARLGACFVQRIDALNGAHTNFNLGLTWRPGWGRLSGISIDHISDAGTSVVNTGRQAVLVDIKLQ